MPDYEQLARQFASAQGINPDYFVNQIRAESNFSPTARSGAGAIGIAQIVPRWNPGVDPTDPIASLKYAAKLDADLLRKYGGDWRQALSVYNSGQPNKWSDPGFASGQTYNYVRKILGENYSPDGTPLPTATSAASTTSTSLPTGTPASVLPKALPTMKIPGLNQPGFAPISPAAFLGKRGDALTQALVNASIKTSDAAMQPITLKLPGSDVSVPAKPGSQPLAVSTTPEHVPATTGTNAVVQAARSVLGTPYSWGGGGESGPSYGIAQGANIKGFDCQALIRYAYAKIGVAVPAGSVAQFHAGQAVPQGQLRPGDAVFFHMAQWAAGYGPGHVGIYIGNGKFIEAPHTGANVRISDLAGRSDYAGARRYA